VKAVAGVLVAALLLSGCAGTSRGISQPLGVRASSSQVGAPTRTEIAHVVRALVGSRYATFGFTSVMDVEIAQDSLGRWWAAGALVPNSPRARIPVFVLVESHRRWKLAGFGTNIDTAEGVKNVPLSAGVSRQLFPAAGNWAGYAVTGGRFTSVSATWVQPRVANTSTRFDCISIWLGLGGLRSSSV
jgi:hypothetical protein